MLRAPETIPLMERTPFEDKFAFKAPSPARLASVTDPPALPLAVKSPFPVIAPLNTMTPPLGCASTPPSPLTVADEASLKVLPKPEVETVKVRPARLIAPLIPNSTLSSLSPTPPNASWTARPA